MSVSISSLRAGLVGRVVLEGKRSELGEPKVGVHIRAPIFQQSTEGSSAKRKATFRPRPLKACEAFWVAPVHCGARQVWQWIVKTPTARRGSRNCA